MGSGPRLRPLGKSGGSLGTIALRGSEFRIRGRCIRSRAGAVPLGEGPEAEAVPRDGGAKLIGDKPPSRSAVGPTGLWAFRRTHTLPLCHRYGTGMRCQPGWSRRLSCEGHGFVGSAAGCCPLGRIVLDWRRIPTGEGVVAERPQSMVRSPHQLPGQ